MEAAREGDVLLAPQPAADVDVLGEAGGALAIGHAPQRALAGAGPTRHDAGARGQQHAAGREQIERRPLVGEDDGIPNGEARHAADAERDPARGGGEGPQQRDRVGPGLREQAVAHPERVEHGVGVDVAGHGHELLDRGRPEEHPALRQRESERDVSWAHGVTP